MSIYPHGSGCGFSRRFGATRGKRRGGLVVELIIAFPVLLAFVLAVVEFGLLLANLKHVDQAAFAGARVASTLSSSSESNSQAEKAVVENQVQRVLEAAGIYTTAVVEVETPDVSADLDAVRVTVWVPLSGLAPDLLGAFGYALEGRFTSTSVTLPRLN